MIKGQYPRSAYRTEPPLDEPEPYQVRKYIQWQKDREEWENLHYEEALSQSRMDQSRDDAILEMCDEGAYFEPQEYK